MITVSYDDSDGIIRTVTYGETPRADMEEYLDRLIAYIDLARLHWGRVRHLVDASQLDFQSDENLKCLAGAGVEIQKAHDKTAVIMRSARAIAQMERMPSQVGTMVFDCFSAARNWLSASVAGDVDFLEYEAI